LAASLQKASNLVRDNWRKELQKTVFQRATFLFSAAVGTGSPFSATGGRLPNRWIRACQDLGECLANYCTRLGYEVQLARAPVT